MTDDSQPIELRVLHAIFHLSQASAAIDAGTLARQLGVSPTAAATACVHLERAGLVDATRARLTMLGLAKACATGAGTGGLPRPIERGSSAARVAAGNGTPAEPVQPPLAARGARLPASATSDGTAPPLPSDAAASAQPRRGGDAECQLRS